MLHKIMAKLRNVTEAEQAIGKVRDALVAEIWALKDVPEDDRIRAISHAGSHVWAIKMWRDEHGGTLGEAKQHIDAVLDS